MSGLQASTSASQSRPRASSDLIMQIEQEASPSRSVGDRHSNDLSLADIPSISVEQAQINAQ